MASINDPFGPIEDGPSDWVERTVLEEPVIEKIKALGVKIREGNAPLGEQGWKKIQVSRGGVAVPAVINVRHEKFAFFPEDAWLKGKSPYIPGQNTATVKEWLRQLNLLQNYEDQKSGDYRPSGLFSE